MFGWLSPATAAADLRRRASEGLDNPIGNISEFAALLGATVRTSRLSATAGGQDALLVPISTGGFQILVDPDATVSEALERALWDRPHLHTGAVYRWRVAHELAHTLAYRATCPPIRRVPWSAQEEDFCDAVADALLVPWSDALAAEDPGLVALRFAAPIAVVLRHRDCRSSAA